MSTTEHAPPELMVPCSKEQIVSMQPTRSVLAAMLVLVCVACGCSSSSSLVGEWRDQSLASRPYRRLLVIALADREDLRRAYEDAFVRELRHRGNDAVRGYTLLPWSTEIDRDAVVKAVADSGADSVIVTRLLKMEPRIVGASPAYTPSVTNLYSYPSAGWYHERPVSGGSRLQAYQTTVATLETSLFDAATARIAWSGTTETFDAEEAQRQIPGLVKTLTAAMVKAKVIA
jgi:hypothetical protein